MCIKPTDRADVKSAEKAVTLRDDPIYAAICPYPHSFIDTQIKKTMPPGGPYGKNVNAPELTFRNAMDAFWISGGQGVTSTYCIPPICHGAKPKG